MRNVNCQNIHKQKIIYVVLRSLCTRGTQVIYRRYTLVFTDFSMRFRLNMSVMLIKSNMMSVFSNHSGFMVLYFVHFCKKMQKSEKIARPMDNFYDTCKLTET